MYMFHFPLDRGTNEAVVNILPSLAPVPPPPPSSLTLESCQKQEMQPPEQCVFTSNCTLSLSLSIEGTIQFGTKVIKLI